MRQGRFTATDVRLIRYLILWGVEMTEIAKAIDSATLDLPVQWFHGAT